VFQLADVDVLLQHGRIAEAEGAIDEIDEEGGEFGEAGDGFVAGCPVGVAVGGDDEGGGVGAIFIATLGVGYAELH